MDKFMEDYERIIGILAERDIEVKKLMQDKIDLLERLIRLYEQINDRPPYFVVGEDHLGDIRKSLTK